MIMEGTAPFAVQSRDQSLEADDSTPVITKIQFARERTAKKSVPVKLYTQNSPVRTILPINQYTGAGVVQPSTSCLTNPKITGAMRDEQFTALHHSMPVLFGSPDVLPTSNPIFPVLTTAVSGSSVHHPALSSCARPPSSSHTVPTILGSSSNGIMTDCSTTRVFRTHPGGSTRGHCLLTRPSKPTHFKCTQCSFKTRKADFWLGHVCSARAAPKSTSVKCQRPPAAIKTPQDVSLGSWANRVLKEVQSIPKTPSTIDLTLSGDEELEDIPRQLSSNSVQSPSNLLSSKPLAFTTTVHYDNGVLSASMSTPISDNRLTFTCSSKPALTTFVLKPSPLPDLGHSDDRFTLSASGSGKLSGRPNDTHIADLPSAGLSQAYPSRPSSDTPMFSATQSTRRSPNPYMFQGDQPTSSSAPISVDTVCSNQQPVSTTTSPASTAQSSSTVTLCTEDSMDDPISVGFDHAGKSAKKSLYYCDECRLNDCTLCNHNSEGGSLPHKIESSKVNGTRPKRSLSPSPVFSPSNGTCPIPTCSASNSVLPHSKEQKLVNSSLLIYSPLQTLEPSSTDVVPSSSSVLAPVTSDGRRRSRRKSPIRPLPSDRLRFVRVPGRDSVHRSDSPPSLITSIKAMDETESPKVVQPSETYSSVSSESPKHAPTTRGTAHFHDLKDAVDLNPIFNGFNSDDHPNASPEQNEDPLTRITVDVLTGEVYVDDVQLRNLVSGLKAPKWLKADFRAKAAPNEVNSRARKPSRNPVNRPLPKRHTPNNLPNRRRRRNRTDSAKSSSTPTPTNPPLQLSPMVLLTPIPTDNGKGPD